MMAGIAQGLLVSVSSTLLVLTLIVTIHELGHFLVAKWCGVAIDRFSIGFGKALVSWRDRSGVEWRIGWIPLGGYVQFAGDENAASVPDHEDLESLRRTIVTREGEASVSRYFHFKPLWQRALVVAAGPVANFLLAIAIFAVLLATFGQYEISTKIARVNPGAPAAAAGFRAGDTIIRANHHPVRSFQDIGEIAQLRVNLPTQFVVRRDGAELTLTATPALRMRPDDRGVMRSQGTLGLERISGPDAYVHVRYAPMEALAGGVSRTWHILDTTVHYLGRMILGQVSTDELGGPLRIAQISRQVAEDGASGATDVAQVLLGVGVNLAGLAATISVGIGFMNLLPIPVLDGGHLLFYAVEAATRRPVAARVQAAGYRVGLALVLCLMLFATWNDLHQLHVFKFLGGLLS